MTNEELSKIIERAISEHLKANIENYSQQLADEIFVEILTKCKGESPAKTIQQMNDEIGNFNAMRREINELRIERDNLRELVNRLLMASIKNR